MKQHRAKAWVTYFINTDLRYFGWADTSVERPLTPESAFCVMPGQEPRTRPLLERTASDLVSATEALALEERAFQVRPRDISIYFSAIVTTAKLKVCQFDPADLSISEGTLSKGTFVEVPFVRFRKQLSTRKPETKLAQGDRFYAMELAKEHTVFVVNAACLLQFLKEIRVDGRFVDLLAGVF